MKLYEVLGNSQKLDGGAMFGNAPKEVWKNWLHPDEKNRIHLACRALLLILDDGTKILLETGIGAFFSPKLKGRFGVVENQNQIVKNLQQMKIAPDEIDYIILSHLHFDHAGGLLTDYEPNKTPKLAFQNAKVLIHHKQWKHACQPHERDRASFIPELHKLLKQSQNLELISDEKPKTFKNLITFRLSHGHTPHLMLSQIQTPKGPLVFCADLIPGSHWVHIPITMGYDRFPELLIEEKKALLEDLKNQNGYLYFTHDPEMAVGKVEQDESGKFFVQPTNLNDLFS